MNECLLSLREAAEYLGYSEDGMWKLVKRSRRRASGAAVGGPTIRFFQPSRGACIRFKREWLDEFIEQHTVDPTAEPLIQEKPKRKTRANRPDLGSIIDDCGSG